MYPFLAFAFVSLALLSGCAPKSSVLTQTTPTENITSLEKFDGIRCQTHEQKRMVHANEDH